MKTEERIKRKLEELTIFADGYTNSHRPTPEGLIFMIQALEWVIE